MTKELEEKLREEAEHHAHNDPQHKWVEYEQGELTVYSSLEHAYEAGTKSKAAIEYYVRKAVEMARTDPLVDGQWKEQTPDEIVEQILKEVKGE